MTKASKFRSAAHLSELMHLIYEAGLHPELWSDVVTAIAASLNASKGLLFTPYVAPQHGGMIFPVGISEQTLQLWGSHYINHDIWAEGLNKHNLWHDGAVCVDEQMCAWPDFLASRFYREFLSGIGIGRVCLGLVFKGSLGLAPTSLSIFRSYDEPAFNEADMEWLRMLVSHVSRSLGVMRRLNLLQLQNTSMKAALDRLAFGVVLLDENLQIQHLNTSARAVLQRGDGLRVNADNQLDSIVTQKRLPQLARWLTAMQSAKESGHNHFLQGCRVSRREGGHYVIQCSPLADTTHWQLAGNASCYVVFITDPTAQTLPPVEKLTTLYDLTPAQAKVALAFAKGDTYKQVAMRLRISEETVRSHVKAIYPKTRLNRQADLVRLVLSLGEHGV